MYPHRRSGISGSWIFSLFLDSRKSLTWGRLESLTSWIFHDILTEIGVVEEDELLPAVLWHHLQDDLIKVDGRADHQGVVVCSGQAAGQRAGGARRPSGRALDEEVRDVHGVRERLQAARRHAADGADQRQDAAVHQLAGWGEGEGEQKEKRGAVILSTHRGMVKTNTARLWTAPAPHLYCYLWAKNAPRTAILVPQISTRVKPKEEGEKKESWCVCCLMLLFFIYCEDLLCTNYKQYGKKWNSDVRLWIYSIFY